MKLKILTFPYDVYSRHRVIAQLINSAETVLDVGGSLRELKHFLPSSTKLLSVDIIGGDVLYNGKLLPFKTNSIDTVVSIDTVEHISKKARPGFIKELARVAQNQIIIAAPLGTNAHIQAEKHELKKQQLPLSKPDQYLVEHVLHGLPTLVEIKDWSKNYPNSQLIFSGNFHHAQTLFNFHRSQINIPKLNTLWFYIKPIFWIFINLILFPLEHPKKFQETINRFYLKIKI